MLVEHRNLRRVEVAESVLTSPHRLRFDVQRHAGGQCSPILGREDVSLGLGDNVVGVLADQFVAGIAGELLARAVEADEPKLAGVLHRQQAGHVLEHRVEEHLGASQLGGLLPQAPLTLLQLLGHGVERPRQARELRGRSGLHADRQITRGHPVGYRRHAPDRPQHRATQVDRRAHEQDQRADESRELIFGGPVGGGLRAPLCRNGRSLVARDQRGEIDSQGVDEPLALEVRGEGQAGAVIGLESQQPGGGVGVDVGLTAARDPPRQTQIDLAAARPRGPPGLSCVTETR